MSALSISIEVHIFWCCFFNFEQVKNISIIVADLEQDFNFWIFQFFVILFEVMKLF